MTVFGQLYTVVDGVPSPWSEVIKIVALVVGAGYLLTKTVKFVPQDHAALRLRFGRVVTRGGKPTTLHPGPHLLVPFAHNLVRVSTLDRVITLRSVRIQLDTYIVVDVSATAVFKVDDIYLVRYVSEDFGEQLQASCEQALRRAFQEHPWHQGDSHELARVHAFGFYVETAAAELGVTFRQLNVTNLAPDAQFAIGGAIASLRPDGDVTA